MKATKKLTRISKRVIATILAAATVFGSVPANIYAEGETATNIQVAPDTNNANTDIGAQNDYSMSFDADVDGNGTETYSAYVYGEGVDTNVCEQLAQAYVDVAVEEGNRAKVVSDNFVDANKSSVEHDYNEGYDSSLCWAYSASNALVQSDWIKNVNAGVFNVDGSAPAYFQTEDDVASYAAYCLYDLGGDESNFWRWIFTGEGIESTKLRYGQDDDDALLSEYYATDEEGNSVIFTKSMISAKDDLNEILTDYLKGKNAANTLGIFHYAPGAGGHAMSINGYIRNANGDPVAVILTDPDDAVTDPSQSDDPRQKEKAYGVYPIVWDETQAKWIVNVSDSFSSRLSDISTIVDSNGYEKINNSIVPGSTRAISDEFNNNEEYSMNNTYSFDIPLNLDFLSFYDINKLKYRILGENNEVVAENSIQKSKSDWKSLISVGAVSVSLSFDEALSGVQDGKYKLQVEIDKDCFFGNYGWFAEKSNYFDKLVDVWVNLFRGGADPDTSRPENNNYTEYEYVDYVIDDGEKSSSNGYYEDEYWDYFDDAMYESIIEAILYEILAEMGLDYDAIMSGYYDDIDFWFDDEDVETNTVVESISKNHVEENVKTVVNDLLKINANDQALTQTFNEMGIDTTKIDIKKMKVILSVAVKNKKAGIYRFVCKDKKYTAKDSVFAMVELTDGRVKYVKANIRKDGSIEVELPESVKEITIIAM